MSETTIRLAEYFYIQTPDQPGEAARVLSWLKDAGVSLLAFSAFPTGRRSQMDFIPEDPAAAKINITATQAVAPGSGRFGALLWVEPRNVKRAGQALGIS